MIISVPEKWLHHKDLIIPFTDELHIWFVDLDSITYDYRQAFNQLPLKDKERLQAIQTENKREISIKRHVILLQILSYYLNKDISEINLEYNEYGKPYLELTEIKFNISNSYNFLLVGITMGNELGVDIEKFRSNVEFDKLVERYFTKNEKDFFTTLSETKKEVFFFDLWTMKEAILKATGLGMRLPLNSFEFPLEENDELVHITYGSIDKEYFVYKSLISNDTSITTCLEKKVQIIKYLRF